MIAPLFAVIVDLWREALSRKWFLGLGLVLTAGMILFGFSLQLDVVDGALAGSKLFGKILSSSSDTLHAADSVLGMVFRALAYTFFYGGALFLCVACADFGPALLRPGRIEHLLSLPVQRWQLLFGTYLGVINLTSVFMLYAAVGSTLILGFKSGVWTWGLITGALVAWLGFAALYAAMLMAAVWVRSVALSAAVGIAVLLAGIVATYRSEISVAMKAGLARQGFLIVTALVPPLGRLPEVAANWAAGTSNEGEAVARVVLGCLAFAGAFLALAAARFENKDY